LSDGKKHNCTFEFPAKNKNILGAEDLERMSISSDSGKKSFVIDFKRGDVSACKAPDGCYGENRVK
jgi:hypothetical protein